MSHFSAHRSGVIYASISGFGSGRGAALPGYDLKVQAISGLKSLTGDPGGDSFRPAICVFDVMSGGKRRSGCWPRSSTAHRTGAVERAVRP